MKKLLVAILCFIPLMSKATNVGGFEFKDQFILKVVGNTVFLLTPVKNELWTGMFNGDRFLVANDAKGKNKIWYMMSAKRGKNNFIESKNIKSILVLGELDCTEYRSRIIKTTAYSEYFAKGEIIYSDDKIYPWSYEENDSVFMALGCSILKHQKSQ